MPTKRKWELRKMRTVDVAADYACRLIEREARGAGDTEGAMRRIEQRYGVGYWTLWSLKYKRPKSVTAEIFQQLRNAYLATCERQLAALTHELALEGAKGGDVSDADLLAEAQALLAKVQERRR